MTTFHQNSSFNGFCFIVGKDVTIRTSEARLLTKEHDVLKMSVCDSQSINNCHHLACCFHSENGGAIGCINPVTPS